MTRPSFDASEIEILAFARDWVRYAARNGLDEAILLLDRRSCDPQWSEAFVRTISEDHFGDGETCIITAPDKFHELRVDAYRYDDGSGFAVDHDLAMNDQRSDFTIRLEFLRTPKGFNIQLVDVHVL